MQRMQVTRLAPSEVTEPLQEPSRENLSHRRDSVSKFAYGEARVSEMPRQMSFWGGRDAFVLLLQERVEMTIGRQEA